MASSEPSDQQHASPSHSRPKQKRNKPTLTCSACTSRKTRCSRDRPKCRQCIRRQTACTYTDVANMLELLGPEEPRERHYSLSSPRSASKDMFDMSFLQGPAFEDFSASPIFHQAAAWDQMYMPATTTPRLESSSSPAMDHKYVSADAEHPFHNYWTKDGGLAEVVTVLPNREQALSLVSSFFESVDPLYPMLSRSHFMAEIENFWALPNEDKYCYDAAKLALHFVVYAAGAYFAPDIDPDERGCMADLYLSASHQSLCLCSYLGKFTLGTAQVILLIGYLLINTNRISEAWTFSGILVRQAYALRLHRNSDVTSSDLSSKPEQLRRRIWQAVVVQDVSIAYHLHLPPSAIRCIDTQNLIDSFDEAISNDLAYEQALWQWATFVQEHICIPQAIGQPISTSPSHKTTLIARYRDIYSKWKQPFNSQNPKRFETVDLRLARQLITVSSNFFGVLTVLYLDENADAGVYPDVYGAIDATHEALSSFFALLRLSPEQMDMWGSYHTRAYAQATRLGRILARETQQPNRTSRDPGLMLGKSDLDRYLDILYTSCGSQKHRRVQEARYKTLKELVDTISIA